MNEKIYKRYLEFKITTTILLLLLVPHLNVTENNTNTAPTDPPD